MSSNLTPSATPKIIANLAKLIARKGGHLPKIRTQFDWWGAKRKVKSEALIPKPKLSFG